jgi:hypothetical protein
VAKLPSSVQQKLLLPPLLYLVVTKQPSLNKLMLLLVVAT